MKGPKEIVGGGGGGEHLVNFPAFAQGNVRVLCRVREGTNMPIPSWEAQLKNEVIKVYIATTKDKYSL